MSVCVGGVSTIGVSYIDVAQSWNQCSIPLNGKLKQVGSNTQYTQQCIHKYIVLVCVSVFPQRWHLSN